MNKWNKGKPEKSGEYLVAYTFYNFPTQYSVVEYNAVVNQWIIRGVVDDDIIIAITPDYWMEFPQLKGSEIDEM